MLKKRVGKGVAKRQDVGVFGKIGAEADDIGLTARDLDKGLAERRVDRRPAGTGRLVLPHRQGAYSLDHGRPPRVCRVPSAGLSHSPGSTRTKSAFSHRSSVGTPQPGRVRSTIACGLPSAARASARAATTAARSLPSISCVAQPTRATWRRRVPVEHESAVGLDPVAVDQRDEVVQPGMRGRHGGLPVRAFLHLAVGKFDEDAGGRMPEPQAERHADTVTESMAERAAGHLDAGRGVERRHVEPAVVGPVGREFVQRDHAGFGERCPERDRIMAGR